MGSEATPDECRLCGYPAKGEGALVGVPLSSPRQWVRVCQDCIDDLLDNGQSARPRVDDLTPDEIRTLIALTEQEADGWEWDHSFDNRATKKKVKVLRGIVEKLRARIRE